LYINYLFVYFAVNEAIENVTHFSDDGIIKILNVIKESGSFVMGFPPRAAK